MMREQELVERLNGRFSGLEARVQRRQRVIVSATRELIPSVLLWLKEQAGYHQLTLISCVDWIEDGEFELVYHVASHASGIHVMVKARIDRDQPVMESIVPIYVPAQPYEREIHELFGVDFPGNPDLTPLYLDDWHELPPLRKDFDTKAYAQRTYDYEQ